MPESGISSRLPAKYRLALTLSLALFAHTLLISLFPLLLKQPEEESPTVRFELVVAGSAPSQQRQSAPASTSENEPQRERQVSPFSVEPLSDQERQSRNPSRKETPSLDTPQAPANRQTPPAAQPQTRTTEAGGASQPDTGSRAGQPTPQPREQPTEATLPSVDLPEQETDPYLRSLIEKLALELDKYPLPELRQLKAPVYITIELQLLGNGTLVRADLEKRSEVRSLDEAAFRAALGASPYPEPPHNSGRQRYKVNLVFSPERL